MNSSQLLQHFKTVTAYTVIFLFTYTASSKLLNPESFELTLAQSPLIKNQAAWLSWLVPVAELLLVLLLLAHKTMQAGLVGSLLLMGLFTAYIAYMVVFVPNLPCSCGGVVSELSWQGHLLMNSLLMLALTIAAITHKKPNALLQ